MLFSVYLPWLKWSIESQRSELIVYEIFLPYLKSYSRDEPTKLNLRKNVKFSAHNPNDNGLGLFIYLLMIDEIKLNT